MLECCSRYYSAWQGGSDWGHFDAWATFFRDVVGVPFDKAQIYTHYETLALNSGPRFMHPAICMISDRPEIRGVELVGQTYRNHNESGPSLRWRDGWSLWHIHGVAVDEQIVMAPETQTLDQIRKESNAEVKRVRIERFAGAAAGEHAGWSKYMQATKAGVLDERENHIDHTHEILVKCEGEHIALLSCCSTGRKYALRVPRDVTSCEAAQGWLSGGLSKYLVDAA